MRPCCLSGRFEWGDGGIAGEAAVRDLNVPARQWIVSSQGFDQSNYWSIARFPRFPKGNSMTQKVSAATATTYARNCGLLRLGTDSPVGGPASAASPCRKKP
jgi:hypothetical protein